MAIGLQRCVAVLSAALLIPFTPQPGWAGSFQVSPITVTVPHSRPVAALSVTNSAEEPLSLRVVTYRWTQEQGEDVHVPTSDLVSSPPIMTIPPGRTQVIRVGLRRVDDPVLRAYRVILEEIPSHTNEGGGVRVALRLSLPFYKLPTGHAKSDLAWSLETSPSGTLSVRAQNNGALHDQVSRVDALKADGSRIPLVERASTILPGGFKHWQAGLSNTDTAAIRTLVIVRQGSTDEFIPWDGRRFN
jgi:fimbrial chaperone protein